MIREPMLAVKIKHLDKLVYPIYASPKLDGIRALVIGGQLVSRKFLPIPNECIQDTYDGLPDGIDGELILRNGEEAGAPYNETQSAVMTEDGDPIVDYYVFDYVQDNVNKPFRDRLFDLQRLETSIHFIFVEQKLITNERELLEYEQECIERGYEGAMVRSINGPYKEGRSTEREGYLLKLKRFEDSEARIVGFEEKQHNNNEQERDEFGRAKRSSGKAGKVGANTLGTVYVIDIHNDIEFDIGTGFDDAMRQLIWNNQKKYLGKIVVYKYQPYGIKEKPRFPVFKGFRDGRDI